MIARKFTKLRVILHRHLTLFTVREGSLFTLLLPRPKALFLSRHNTDILLPDIRYKVIGDENQSTFFKTLINILHKFHHDILTETSQTPGNTTTDHQPRSSIFPYPGFDNLQAKIRTMDENMNRLLPLFGPGLPHAHVSLSFSARSRGVAVENLRLMKANLIQGYGILLETCEEIMELKAKVASLNTEMERITNCYDNEIQILNKNIKERDRSISDLRRMIVKSHRRDNVYNDAEIANKFITLRSSILEFCKTHFPEGMKFPRKLNVSPEMSELGMRAEVANWLHWAFFNPSLQLFGYLDNSDPAHGSEDYVRAGLSVGCPAIENHVMTSLNPEITGEIRSYKIYSTNY